MADFPFSNNLLTQPRKKKLTKHTGFSCRIDDRRRSKEYRLISPGSQRGVKSGSGTTGTSVSDLSQENIVPKVVDSILHVVGGIDRGDITEVIKLMARGESLPFIARYRSQVIPRVSETNLREIDMHYERVVRLELTRQEATEQVVELIDNDMVEIAITEIESANSVAELEMIIEKYSSDEAGLVKELQSAFEDLDALTLSRHVRICGRNSCCQSLETSGAANNAVTLIGASIFADSDCRTLSNRVLHRQCHDLQTLKPHQWLALSREGKATPAYFQIESSAIAELLVALYTALVPVASDVKTLSLSSSLRTNSCADLLVRGIRESIVKHILPSLRKEWVSELENQSQLFALENFSTNLRHKLLQPGVQVESNSIVFAIDPGLASGCKVVVYAVSTGSCLDTFKFNATSISSKVNVETFQRFRDKYRPIMVVLGDGTGSTETRAFLAHIDPHIEICIVSEAGASRYSISELSMREWPDLAVEYRGCISLVRRALDPLSELSKIEPQHLSVGMYQHDLPKKTLQKYLHNVVSECVAAVGVDLNTASEHVLALVPGLDAHKAHAIVYYRNQILGRPYRNRFELRDVPGLDQTAWLNAIGFIRVVPSDLSPLDGTCVHPEQYIIANEVVKHHMEFSHLYSPQIPAPPGPVSDADEADILRLLTLSDPRDSSDPIPIKPARDWVTDPAAIGAKTYGTVQTVTSFGAFVSLRNLGITTDGLLHISQYPIGVTDPHYYKANQEVQVMIESAEKSADGKVRISLTTRFSP